MSRMGRTGVCWLGHAYVFYKYTRVRQWTQTREDSSEVERRILNGDGVSLFLCRAPGCCSGTLRQGIREHERQVFVPTSIFFTAGFLLVDYYYLVGCLFCFARRDSLSISGNGWLA